MTSDPFPGRCRRCGIGMMVDADDCGRGPHECKTELAQLRDMIAGACSALLRGARWLGLVEK